MKISNTPGNNPPIILNNWSIKEVGLVITGIMKEQAGIGKEQTGIRNVTDRNGMK